MGEVRVKVKFSRALHGKWEGGGLENYGSEGKEEEAVFDT